MLKFRSKITVKVLDYYFTNPQKARYINELAGLLEVDPGNLYRKLKELENENILVQDTKGNQKYYSLNKDYPLLKEIKKAYEAKYGFKKKLGQALKGLKGLDEAYLYGSFATGQPDKGSDIDLLLIGSHSGIGAARKILPLEKFLGREINIIDMTRREYENRRQKDDFLKQVLSTKPIKLI